MALLKTSSWRARAICMAWAFCSQSLVVNRNVTVPVGGLGTTVMSSLIPSRGQHYSSEGVPGPLVHPSVWRRIRSLLQNTLIRCLPTCVEGWPARLEPASAYISPLPPNASHWCIDWCDYQCASLLGQGGDEFAAELGDVGDNAAPDQVPFAERRLVNPNRAGVLQVVFDPQRARGPRPIDDAGGDRDEPAVADDADGLVPFVHCPDEARNLGIAPELVRCPAARHHYAVQLRGVDTVRRRVGLRLQGVLAADRFGVWPDGDDLGPLLLQAHHSDPVLEVFEALGHENRDPLPL